MLAGHKFTGEELISISRKVYADLQKSELQRTHLHTHGHVNTTSSEAPLAYSFNSDKCKKCNAKKEERERERKTARDPKIIENLKITSNSK